MTIDTRPLHVRVRALAQRFDAIASGARKRADAIRQAAEEWRSDVRDVVSSWPSNT